MTFIPVCQLFLRDAYAVITAAGPEGDSLAEPGNTAAITTLCRRGPCRHDLFRDGVAPLPAVLAVAE